MEPNYFTCTLGQAAVLRIQQPHKTVNDLLEAQAQAHPNRPAVGFPGPIGPQDGKWDTSVLTFDEARRGRDYTANKLVLEHQEVLQERQIIGLLCPSTPEFLFTWLASMRLGHAVLLIAPQCQPPAIASLCISCGVSLLLYNDVYEEQARRASEDAKELGQELCVSALPFNGTESRRENFLSPNGINKEQPLPVVAVKESDIAYLHHTSGTSSGMPKPIPQTHLAGVGVLPSLKDGHEAATFTTTPLYHGGIADLFRAWTSSAMIWLFPGKHVPITASNIIRCLDVAEDRSREQRTPPVKYFSSVPYVLQMMEADSCGLRYLQEMDIVGVGGAALPAEVGDRLVNNGVNLISRFGSAECGFLASSHRDYRIDKEWQYLRIPPGVNKYLSFERQAEDSRLAELVVLPGWPHMAKCNREDGSFATSDLFAAHESVSNAWRYHSRADSQLTLITGKKFDPAPLEASIATSELVDNVLIFGNGKPYPGALVFRSHEARESSDEEFLARIWPMVEKLNNGSQGHARIARSMLIPMKTLERPLEKSSKGTILRGAAETRFQEQIEAAYIAIDEHDASSHVTDGDLPQAIKEIITSVVRKGDLSYSVNLFSYGVDSVAGMQIRGKLRKFLPADAAETLPINVVEDCGSVERLAEFVRRRREGEVEVDREDTTDELEYMKQLVEEYSRFEFTEPHDRLVNGTNSDHTAVNDVRSAGETIILTGATGALGAHIFDQYRRKGNIRKIYCLIRSSDEHAASERVNKALSQRQLQSLRGSLDAAPVVVLPAVLGDPRLGLDDAQYEKLASEATIIMHVAWSVNFRMRLRSFVKDSIAGVTNLLNLALASTRSQPPVFAFCSSVASAMAYTGPGPVPEQILSDPASADVKGYSRSKWVAEHICERAALQTRLRGRVKIFRVGQLAGDTVHGAWNTKEAWPLMLSAVKVTKSLPDLKDEPLSWLPVDIAASALIQGAASQRDTSSSNSRPVAVFHVLNQLTEGPTWTDLLGWLEKETIGTFAIVSPSQWIRDLEVATTLSSSATQETESSHQHPSIQLLDHWKQAYQGIQQVEEGKKLRPATFDVACTKELIPVLNHEVEPVSEGYFNLLWRWIQEYV
jgi:thioester reductase-like protein